MTEEGRAPALSDAELELMTRQRFQARLDRVLAVMREERIDWRAVAYVTADGRLAARVAPVDVPTGRLAEVQP